MSDRYGALSLPARKAFGAAAGDPGLSVLLDYCKAYVNAKIVEAWQEVAPSLQPIANVFTHDPSERSFNEKYLPALYGWRTGGPVEQIAADYRQATDSITLRWVFQPAQQAHQRLRDPMVNAIVKALDRGLYACRDASWLAERDKADADAFKLATATSTSAQQYSGVDLDGVVGAEALVTPRKLTITTAAAVGAYALTPIVMTYVDTSGALAQESISLTTANGGEVRESAATITRLISLDVPAQLLTTGSLQFGHTADEDALDRGSVLLRHAGFERIELQRWAPGKLIIRMDQGADQGESARIAARTYETIDTTLRVTELLVFGPADTLDGIDVDIVREDDSLIEQMQLNST